MDVQPTDAITLHEVDDETVEVLVNGEHLITLTHDEDGWSGMGRIENMLEELAARLGISFSRD
jgi:hypothetical protein